MTNLFQTKSGKLRRWQLNLNTMKFDPQFQFCITLICLYVRWVKTVLTICFVLFRQWGSRRNYLRNRYWHSSDTRWLCRQDCWQWRHRHHGRRRRGNYSHFITLQDRLKLKLILSCSYLMTSEGSIFCRYTFQENDQDYEIIKCKCVINSSKKVWKCCSFVNFWKCCKFY